MTVLLDENIPLGLLRRLQAAGIAAEHIITLGWRGAPDSRIRQRLSDPSIVFLTHDEDFLFGPGVRIAVVVVSRVRQSRRLAERTEIWFEGLHSLLHSAAPERLWELLDDGSLVPWRDLSAPGT